MKKFMRFAFYCGFLVICVYILCMLVDVQYTEKADSSIDKLYCVTLERDEWIDPALPGYRDDCAVYFYAKTQEDLRNYLLKRKGLLCKSKNSLENCDVQNATASSQENILETGASK